jgi:LysM repeat protein
MGMSLWQKSIVVLLGVTIFGGAAYFARIVFHPIELDRYRSIPWVTYVHPNIKKLQEAKALTGEGKLDEARAILVKALITAPKSPVTRELRDLLGNINAQMFFSEVPSPGKIEYTVKPGDALSSIARKLDSSTDAITRINHLDSTVIRPEQRLLVPRLDFNIVIDLVRSRVIVCDSRGFFCQYPIVSANLPHSRKPTIQTKVTAKSFAGNGGPVRPADRFHNKGRPQIDLDRAGYVLYGVGEENNGRSFEIAVEAGDKKETTDSRDANRPPQGIAMLNKDIAEIQLLIRKDTPVSIIFEDTSDSQA